MTFINDIPEGEHRERLRRELLGIVGHRASEYDASFGRLTTFLGAVCSGSVVAVLALINQRSTNAPISVWALAAVAAFTLSLVTFAAALYWHFQLHSRRYNLAAEIAEGFFQREYSLEDWLENSRRYQSANLYKLVFWGPSVFLVSGVVFSVLFIIGTGPMLRNAPVPGNGRADAAQAGVGATTAHRPAQLPKAGATVSGLP